MDRFYFFRLKLVTKKDQKVLFEFNRSDLLKKIIMLHPGAYVRKGIEWIMANTHEIDHDAVFFKFGRLARKTKDKFDHEKRQFVEAEDDLVDISRCIYDSSNQVLAIEKCSNTPSPNVLAKYIVFIINSLPDGPLFQYLDKNEQLFLSMCLCKADVMTDPIDFIEYISSAYKVLEFDVTFYRKNPPDFNELLQEPMQKFLEETGGDESIAGVKSEDGLQAQALIEIAHAAAASGSDAYAKIKKRPELRSERIKMKTKQSVASMDHEEGDDKDSSWLLSLLASIRERYKTIRGKDDK